MSDYGFSKLLDLFESIPHVVDVSWNYEINLPFHVFYWSVEWFLFFMCKERYCIKAEHHS